MIYKELKAQVEKIIKAGITITHLDTHHHVHEFFNITVILVKIQKEYKIPAIRILNNIERPSRLHKKAYRNLINLYLKKNNATYSDLFGDQSDALIQLKEDPLLINKKTIEVMVHPDYDIDGKLIDKIGNKRLDFAFLKSLNIS